MARRRHETWVQPELLDRRARAECRCGFDGSSRGSLGWATRDRLAHERRQAAERDRRDDRGRFRSSVG